MAQSMVMQQPVIIPQQLQLQQQEIQLLQQQQQQQQQQQSDPVAKKPKKSKKKKKEKVKQKEDVKSGPAFSTASVQPGVKRLFGSFDLLAKEPYTIMLCSSCVVVVCVQSS